MTAAATLSPVVFGVWNPPRGYASRAEAIAFHRQAAKAMQNKALARLARGDWPPLPCAAGYMNRAAMIVGPAGYALGGAWAIFSLDSRDREVHDIYAAAARELADFINGWAQ